MRDKVYRTGDEKRKTSTCAKYHSNEVCKEHKARASCTDTIMNSRQERGRVLKEGKGTGWQGLRRKWLSLFRF